jgi:anti-anti-sigma factor
MEKINIFYSYSHDDLPLRNQLETHLANLKRQGLVDTWSDRMITPGNEWSGEIDNKLESSQLVLLLISPSFIASDYCYDVEMKRAINRHEAGEAKVIPIILRPVDWTAAPFSKLQALPTDAKPVTRWRNRDEAFVDVVNGIRRAIDEIRLTPRFHLTEIHGVTVVEFLNPSLDYEPLIKALGDYLYNLARKDTRARILLNFRNLESINHSTLLGKFIHFHRMVISNGGKLKFCCASPSVMETFKITRLDSVLEFYDTQQQALQEFGSH